MKNKLYEQGNYNQEEIENLKTENRFLDCYDSQIEELWEIQNPPKKDISANRVGFQNFKEDYQKNNSGSYIYFAGEKLLVKIVNRQDYQNLLTNRNQYLIKKEEQDILLSKKVGFIGMSVGGNIAINLAHSGIGAAGFLLSDFDVLSTANLNRVLGDISHVGKSKIDFIERKILGTNPYHDLIKFEDGLNLESLDKFFASKPDLLVDECDDFKIKIQIRYKARENKVPVIMVANLGDTIVLDVERFDEEENLQILNGMLPEEVLHKLAFEDVSKEDVNKYAVMFVKRENVPQRAIESVMDIGKNLVGRPQLMSTASIGAGYMTYIAREILLKKGIKSGRYILKFDTLFT